MSGRSSKIRTYDPHVPNVVLYQAELYSEGAPYRPHPGALQRTPKRPELRFKSPYLGPLLHRRSGASKYALRRFWGVAKR